MAKRRESTFERLQKGQPLNRRQKRELAARLNSADPGFEIVHRHAAGIDIGNESHYVAVPAGRDEQPVREFGSWTADLERMAQWLKDCGIQSVVMQSTGVYWMAVYEILQGYDFQVNLVDARGTKNLPGRKSDVQECQWLLRLHTYGLLRSCFLPPESIRRLRTAWRLRDRHVKEAGRCVQHMQRALTEMNVQLHNTISDLGGVTGQAIVRALLAGERDPVRLAALRDRRIQASPEELLHSLRGNWKEEALFELQQAVEAYDFYGRQIAECDRRLQPYLAALPSRESVPEAPAAEAPTNSGPAQKPEISRKLVKRKGNEPPFDIESEQRRILGVDATTIDGIDVMTVQTVLAEVGSDLSAWKTERHWSSWLNLAPKRDVSGGRVIRHTREHRTNRVGNAFRMAAQSLIRSQSYLGARFRYLRAKLGGVKAVKAMARVLACLFYRLLTKGQIWVDRGTVEFEVRRQQREFAALQRKARDFGMQLVPTA
jgi:transposase